MQLFKSHALLTLTKKIKTIKFLGKHLVVSKYSKTYVCTYLLRV